MTRGSGSEGDRGEIDAIAFDGRSAEWFLLMAKAQRQVVRRFGSDYFDQDDIDAREISDAGISLLQGVAGSHPLQASGGARGVFGL